MVQRPGTPEACDPLFDALIGRGNLTVADRRERFRLATQAGNVRLARLIAGDLPAGERISAAEFAPVDKDPARSLASGNFRWRQPGGRELALYALERAARSDAAQVRPAWEKQRGQLPEAERRYGNARIAYHAARQLRPEAHAWYLEAGEQPLGEVERAWRVRAALRAGSWNGVLAAIDGMPAAQAAEPAWRYWRARALAALGRGPRPTRCTRRWPPRTVSIRCWRPTRRAAGREDARAAAGGGRDGSAWLAAFGARADVKRVLKLAQLELRPEMLREWAQIVRGADDDTLLAAADYARRQGALRPGDQHRRAHRVAARLRPALPHALPQRIRQRRRATTVDEAMLLGIARQESRFVPEIVSSAGAVGLMQLMPATARWVARELKRTDFRPTASPRSGPTPASARSTSSTGWTASTRSRRSRPLRIMRAPAGRRPGATARRWRARSGSRRFPSTRPAITSRRCSPTPSSTRAN
ncbi:MAG: transglycosylase SLT domain-containing protein [Betaproteobacteria bacterium]|nr:transglycosylase SLT domain-containing protein [Betaproteobacteria bacterium]